MNPAEARQSLPPTRLVLHFSTTIEASHPASGFCPLGSSGRERLRVRGSCVGGGASFGRGAGLGSSWSEGAASCSEASSAAARRGRSSLGVSLSSAQLRGGLWKASLALLEVPISI